MPNHPPSDSSKPKPHKLETLKQESNHLRGTIAQELATDTDHFQDPTTQLLKFHGIYQQDDRDLRERTPEGIQKTYSLMVRGRIPGGRLTPQQYVVWDTLGDQYGGGSLRITTRQSFQLHGVLKENMKATIQTLHEALMSTVAACGDVVRNVTQAPNPLGTPQLNQLDAVAQWLSDHFKPQSHGYHEIWLDGEHVNPFEESEPIYGETYLPRKFKIGITIAGNNSIDLYTNDMGLAATFGTEGQSETIDGFFVFAGGGLGMSHSNPNTYPRAADCLGWIPESGLHAVAEAIVTTQRDYGNRTNRKRARLKYLMDDQGVAWFKGEVEKRSGIPFQDKPLPPWKTPSYLGWKKRTDGTWSLGFHTLSGRIKDREEFPLKTILRQIVETHQLPVQLTPDQDLILLNVTDEAKTAIEALLSKAGISPESPASVYDRALACPALPTCGLALTESERYFPDLLPGIQEILDRLQLAQRAPVVRMTGCPNGCARPYSAELSFVGRTAGAYAVYIGGDPEGTRIGKLLNDNVKQEELTQVVEKLFLHWKTHGDPTEAFGHYTYRANLDDLKRVAALN